MCSIGIFQDWFLYTYQTTVYHYFILYDDWMIIKFLTTNMLNNISILVSNIFQNSIGIMTRI